MRKIKLLVASLLFCAMSYAGYMGYERVTMSEAERFMQANVEALTSGESGGGIYEYPDGYALTSKCGVKISDGLFGNRCKVVVISCQGGGRGCNTKKCPVHS